MTAPILLALLGLSTACGDDARMGPGVDAGAPDDAAPATRPDPPPPDDGTWEGDPVTCEHAAFARTYVGCDFYPTVLPNVVKDHFDYAVVVANTSDVAASITIDRGGEPVQSGAVGPNDLTIFYLPWVMDLKVENEACSDAPGAALDASAHVPDAAYHLSSSVPVTVYQFNPLQYGPQGGPPGKDWSACESRCNSIASGVSCHSYTNDASLLLPSTVATGNYRITGMAGEDQPDEEMEGFGTIPGYESPAYVSVTGLHDGTTVAVEVGRRGGVVAGGPIPAAGPGDVFTFRVDRGDVVRLLGAPGADLAGSLVQADRPVQVLSGNPCRHVPAGWTACDHLEESVLPAESLGREYVVTRPTGPNMTATPYVVRFVGNVDGTTLSYPAGAPPGAPTRLDAGEVVELSMIEQDFHVVGDHELAVVSFLPNQGTLDPGFGGSRGDPAQTNVVAVEQFRTEYVFLAPTDYDVSVADVVVPMGAEVRIDGAPIGPASPIGSSGYGVVRVELGDGVNGRHRLEANRHVGLQVMGYGFATSYQYPGGLNVRGIAPPPPDLI